MSAAAHLPLPGVSTALGYNLSTGGVRLRATALLAVRTHDGPMRSPSRRCAPTPCATSLVARARKAVVAFLKDYYIYLVLVLVVVVLSTANLDKFPLFERGNFLSERNIINILRVSAPILTLAGAFTLLMISGYIKIIFLYL